MNYRGGVILIGSLLWDNAKREKWRIDSLESRDSKIPLSLKIRYGRESRSRNDTYTMIFSNHPSTGLGQGYIIEFNKKTRETLTLEEQAIALAQAEGIWTVNRPFIACQWGAVGLLVNAKNSSANSIIENWKNIFGNNRSLFDSKQYSICDELPVIDKLPVINEDGFLKIDWQPEMDDFDFLIATPTVPKQNLLTATNIAERMIEKKYRKYFDENRKWNIKTFQDDAILKILDHGI